MKSYESLPYRAKQNKELRKTTVFANRYKLDISKIKCMSIFAIKIVNQKTEDNYQNRIALMYKIIPQLKEFIDNPIVKDGLIYSLNAPKTPDKTIVFGDFVVVVHQIFQFDPAKDPTKLIFFLSNVLKTVLDKIGFLSIDQNNKFINIKKPRMQIEGLFVYSGFKMNFQLLDNSFYLTIDTTTKVVRRENVLEYIFNLYKINEILDREEKREIVRKNLLNKIIMTNYGKTRYQKIQDILFFDLTKVIVESCKMYLHEYYLFRYNYEIKNLKQPIIINYPRKTKKSNYLIPQLCLMTGVPEDFSEASFRNLQMSAQKKSRQRAEEIDEFITKMKENQQNLIFPTLGINIEQKKVQIQAKLIPFPKILFGDGKSVMRGRETMFNPQDMHPFRIKEAIKIAVITFEVAECYSIIEYFQQYTKRLKIKLKLSVIKDDSGLKNKVMSLQKIIKLIDVAKEIQKASFCLIFLPTKMRGLYSRIKEQTLLRKQINCQIVLENTFRKKNVMTIAFKILIQILVKTGNTFWSVVPEINKPKVMFAAFHNTELKTERSEVFNVAICSNCDEQQNELFSNTKICSKQISELQCMKQLLLESLMAYKNRNGYSPEDIVVLENEKSSRNDETTISFLIQPLLALLKEWNSENTPNLIYIKMTKCLGERLFRKSEGKFMNPVIGTLIESQITKNKNSFYIVAHESVNGGSICPLRYTVIFSNSKMERKQLHSMLFSQCFSYQNYSGSIRFPSMVQSAIKCAKFGSQILYNMEVHEKFKLYPYYL